MILSSLWRRILGMSDKALIASALGVLTRNDVVYGSNANGQYWRIPDSNGSGGLQVCIASINSSASADVTWTYPAAFDASPFRNGGVGTGAAAVRSFTTSSVNSSSLDFRIVDGTGARIAATASLIAVGRYT